MLHSVKSQRGPLHVPRKDFHHRVRAGLTTGTSMWTSDGRDLLAGVTPSEIRDAHTGYYAYFGTYTVDESARTVTHHIQASVRPEEVGRDYVRYPVSLQMVSEELE